MVTKAKLDNIKISTLSWRHDWRFLSWHKTAKLEDILWNWLHNTPRQLRRILEIAFQLRVVKP